MKRSILIVAASIALAGAGGALGQGYGSPATPSTPATPATPDNPAAPETPATPPDTGASSAGAIGANTSSTAAAQLASGVQVRDRDGHTIGRITSLTTVGGEPQAVVRIGSRNVTVPASNLTMSGRFAVSSQTRAQLLGTPAAH